MNLTLHLTRSCNMDCTYCTQEKTAVHMSRAVLHAACELAFSEGIGAGFCFFGGEPLLCEDLIFEAMDFCKLRSEQTGKPVCYKATPHKARLTAWRHICLHLFRHLARKYAGQIACQAVRRDLISGSLIHRCGAFSVSGLTFSAQCGKLYTV